MRFISGRWPSRRSCAFRSLNALTDVSAFYARRRSYPEAIHYLQRALELAPWQEECHRQLMRVLALDGQRSAALAQYDSCVGLLAETLDMAPTTETTALRDRIEAGLLEPEVMEASNPYRGLFAFDEEDAFDFYGRDKLKAQLLDRIETQPLVAIVGASGSGKSSLLHAGLLPSLPRARRILLLSHAMPRQRSRYGLGHHRFPAGRRPVCRPGRGAVAPPLAAAGTARTWPLTC